LYAVEPTVQTVPEEEEAQIEKGYTEMTAEEVVISVTQELARRQKRNVFVCITGGEPLIYGNEIVELCNRLTDIFDDNVIISIETNGSFEIPIHKNNIYWIVDVKCPSSNEQLDSANIVSVLKSMQPHKDEVKFVIGGDIDYEWAKGILSSMVPEKLIENRNVIFSPVILDDNKQWPMILANKILDDELPVRFQIQLHKVLWPDKKRGI